MKFRLFSLLLALLLTASAVAQDINEAELIENIHTTVSFLADDELKGREAGSPEEIAARDYIVNKFEELGLRPYFEDSFIQEFDFTDDATYQDGAYLKIGAKEYAVDNDYFPLRGSGSGEIEALMVDAGFGLVSPDESVNDYKNLKSLKGKVFVIELSVPGGAVNYKKHEDYADVDSKVKAALDKGASAVLFVNTDSTFSDPRKLMSNKASSLDIPVLFLTNGAKPKVEAGKTVCAINMNIKTNAKKAYNVAAKIDVGAETDLVIGGHYDHLGMGGRTSRYRGNDPFVHNGADDNASGIAAIIELARYFNQKDVRSLLRHNLVFVAFSAEEKGLFGSRAFVDNEIFKPEKAIAMLNFDMVGRLSEEEPKLTLIGTGTAKEWDTFIEKLPRDDFDIAKSESGIGGSDHTSFYLKKIPVLFFFTGIHADYHMPDDDVERLNIAGEAKVVLYAVKMIGLINETEEMNYVKTGNEQPQGGRHGAKYKVTLGVMPDYASSEDGFKIMAVTDGNPAQKAGLQGGDVIVQLGDIQIKDIYDYMKALGKFNKGDKAVLKYKREGKLHETHVVF